MGTTSRNEDEELDIGAVLDFYGLQYRSDRRGEQSIKCPIHEDRTPSASLNLDKGLWNCFSCNTGGDAISLIMTREVLTYEAALKIYQGITGTGDKPVRTKPRQSSPVPTGQGYRPRFRRIIQAGLRRKADFGS